MLYLDKYKDVIAGRYGKAMAAEVVHHIYPADKYPEYAWEDWNLISVSAATHNRLHERDGKTLTEEGERLMRRTKPGKDWRRKHDSTT